MKKVLYFILALLSIEISRANSTDTIPNGSFEYWSFLGWTEDPTFWWTSNSSILAPTVVKDSISHSGFLAMMLTYQGLLQPQAYCGFPLTSHPSNLGGYVKNQMNPDDSAIVTIRIFYNQQIVDSGYKVIYGNLLPGYTPFIAPISQDNILADSCVIQFSVGMAFQSTVSFDDLQLDFTLGIPEMEQGHFAIYPNPCGDHVSLKSGLHDFIPDFIEAYDVLGQRHQIPFDKNNADRYIVELNTSELRSGIWILVVRDGKETQTMLLVKN